MSCGSPPQGHMDGEFQIRKGDTSGHRQKHDAVTAEMNDHQSLPKEVVHVALAG